MGIRRKSRELVVQAFYALTVAEKRPYLADLQYLSTYQDILKDLADENGIDYLNKIYVYADKIMSSMLVKLDEIDEYIKKNLGNYTFEKIGLLELIIMRMSIYEMFFENTPPEVMINEAVDIAKKFCAEKSPALINAILDKIRIEK